MVTEAREEASEMARTTQAKDHAIPTSPTHLAKFVFEEVLGGGENAKLPYNPKWRNLEEQSYLVLGALRLLRSYMEAQYQKGMTRKAVSDCLTMLEPVIGFLDAVDLTALVMEKERAQRGERGKGKTA